MKRVMDKAEIAAEQDKSVEWLHDAMRLQKKSGYRICAWFPGRELPAPCDSVLRKMLGMTTRPDLQAKIKAALYEIEDGEPNANS